MAVAKRWKRKIEVNGQSFWWYVKDDPDRPGLPFLYIISQNKKFRVAYELGQLRMYRHSYNEVFWPCLRVLGAEFPGASLSSKIRFLWTPIWQGDDLVVTPAFVHFLLEWCLDEQRELIEPSIYGRK